MDLVRKLQKFFPQGITYTSLPEARALWQAHREKAGLHGAPPLLTPPENNVKYHKTLAHTYGLSLAPDKASGDNVCRFATSCRDACVAYAGHGELPKVLHVRIVRTQFLSLHPEAFVTLLFEEVRRIWVKHGRNARVRLNGFSDIPWERLIPDLFERFPLVQFYDYTKWPLGTRTTPSNYHLTYSASEHTTDSRLVHDARFVNQAVVFNTRRGQALPMTYLGVKVIDGDVSDDRSADPKHVIVGLRAKGRMRYGDQPMVRDVGSFT